MCARQRPSNAEAEKVLDGLLSGADQSMVNAFTSGFRVSQIKLAISKHVNEPVVSLALESAQVVALAILVREQLDPAVFMTLYRPFATVLPGPGFQPPAPVDRQIASFLARLPGVSGPVAAEVATVARILSEPPKAAAPGVPTGPTPNAPGGGGILPAGPPSFDPSAQYSGAWKAVIEMANRAGRTMAFRAAQDGAEMAAPHDGSGIVGYAGVAAGGIFMRDLLTVEQVLLLYEPFSAAIPYESLV
jgi:hypothetical protein